MKQIFTGSRLMSMWIWCFVGCPLFVVDMMSAHLHFVFISQSISLICTCCTPEGTMGAICFHPLFPQGCSWNSLEFTLWCKYYVQKLHSSHQPVMMEIETVHETSGTKSLLSWTWEDLTAYSHHESIKSVISEHFLLTPEWAWRLDWHWSTEMYDFGCRFWKKRARTRWTLWVQVGWLQCGGSTTIWNTTASAMCHGILTNFLFLRNYQLSTSSSHQLIGQ